MEQVCGQLLATVQDESGCHDKIVNDAADCHGAVPVYE